MKPEEKARLKIDQLLEAAGWIVQDYVNRNLYAGLGIAIREFPLKTGFADYLLFVDHQAVGVIEAKPEGTTLSGVADQSGEYLVGLPAAIPHASVLDDTVEKLPFAYESTGVETVFRDERDPEPRSRKVFSFHQPATLLNLLDDQVTLRGRLRQLPALNTSGMWRAQIQAIENLELSLAQDKPRALIQMATGSGKTFTAVSFIYRLIKFGKVRRVLFLVDRANLGKQTLKEFQQYVTPDDGRKFSELYNVQRLTTNAIDPVNQVVITTIQRLYSMLQGEPYYPEENEEGSLFESESSSLYKAPLPVVYNPAISPETFDVIVTDECHRSIYNLWRQVLEYFDSYVIGLTATPSKQTFGFFFENLVMEYPRQRAVLDGVNVEGHVYRIKTQITEQGSKIEAGFYVDKRDKLTRKIRWEQLDEDFQYSAGQLNSEVVSESQIRTVIRTFKDKLFAEIFPGRTEVPKTLIFAKDDSHAEDIVRIVREEFGKGNEFCQKITYRVSGANPEDLIATFRNSYHPRIAVTVDMIATGTDIKPLECLLFMRLVRSANFFEQMLGRGTRVISSTDLRAVTPDAPVKDHFVIVDAVGVVELPKVDTQTLEKKRTVAFPKLLDAIANGIRDEDTLSSLAGRLSKLEMQVTAADEVKICEALDKVAHLLPGDLPKPQTLSDLAHRLLDAIDPDTVLAKAVSMSGNEQPDSASIQKAQTKLAEMAARPLAASAELRNLLIAIQQRKEQLIDIVSVDHVISAGFNAEATEQARGTVESFRAFIQAHKDEIAALKMIYERPYGLRELTYRQVKELAEQLQQPPMAWTTEKLWSAYAQLEKDRVRGVGSKRVLTDLVSLVRHAVQMDDELVPFPERVQARYADWLAAQEAAGKTFASEQRWWLDRIVAQIGVNLHSRVEDLNSGEFMLKGGQIGASRVFGPGLKSIIDEINSVLVD